MTEAAYDRLGVGKRREPAFRRRQLRRGSRDHLRPPLERSRGGHARASQGRARSRRDPQRRSGVRAALLDDQGLSAGVRRLDPEPYLRAGHWAEELSAFLGDAEIHVRPVPVPHDCRDGFLLRVLDLDDGSWDSRYADLRDKQELDVGLRLVTAEIGRRGRG